MGLQSLLQGYLYFLYVNDVRTPQEIHLWDSADCYGDITILYLDYVRTSQELHLWASKACYRDTFTFYL
jgi:hypothetical protein